jgi:hypothetical protein
MHPGWLFWKFVGVKLSFQLSHLTYAYDFVPKTVFIIHILQKEI